ncbi:LysR substrate-binding domain-containing protein [Neptuniibacter sp. QD48_55]|uniref:LysR substrate-binding domain-containing protein n=1 Tax=Neptuniibacter sp. QD48_55 TaxID=3398212 RepID=UPI0039F61100
MRNALPPLRAVIAFEAAVRHGSFKEAAEELHITPGAVSQQVRKLEEWLGYPLFVREIRKLTVTEKGMSYFSLIAPALEQLSKASGLARTKDHNKVRLSLTQALASKWLGPRLENFVSQYPEVELHINASNRPVDFQSNDIDLAIRHFDGQSQDLTSHLVFDDEVRLYCTQSYKQAKGLDSVNDLDKTTLIITTLLPMWDRWLSEFTDLRSDERAKIPALHFDQTLLAIDAAKRDQGVVLSNALLVQEELKRGELIEPFNYRLSVEKSYYLVYPNNRTLSPAANLFKDWLLGQFL